MIHLISKMVVVKILPINVKILNKYRNLTYIRLRLIQIINKKYKVECIYPVFFKNAAPSDQIMN